MYVLESYGGGRYLAGDVIWGEKKCPQEEETMGENVKGE